MSESEQRQRQRRKSYEKKIREHGAYELHFPKDSDIYRCLNLLDEELCAGIRRQVEAENGLKSSFTTQLKSLGVNKIEKLQTKCHSRCRCCGLKVPPKQDMIKFRYKTEDDKFSFYGRRYYIHLHDCSSIRPTTNEIIEARLAYSKNYRERVKRIKKEIRDEAMGKKTIAPEEKQNTAI